MEHQAGGVARLGASTFAKPPRRTRSAIALPQQLHAAVSPSLEANSARPAALKRPRSGAALVGVRCEAAPLELSVNQRRSEFAPTSSDTPPLVREVRHGVVGASRFAKQLRRELFAARASDRPVLLRGEPGLHKEQLAALVHFGGVAAHRGAPLARLSCAALKPWRLFGLVDDNGVTQLRPGALDWLAAQPAGASLLLEDVHALPGASSLRAALARLLSEGVYQATDRHGEPVGPLKPARGVRLLLTADSVTPDVTDGAPALMTIKVPPLRVRRADVCSTAAFVLRQLVRSRGQRLPPAPGFLRGAYPQPPALSRDARHLLEGCDFANNEAELEVLVKGALAHASAMQPQGTNASASAPASLLLDADMFWSPTFAQRLSRSNANLFAWFPALRSAWRSPLWPEALNMNFTRWVYPLVVALLLWGPQTREANPALVVFWAWWWPGVLATFPLVGRLWCAVCPFMIYGELAQRWRLATGATLLPWPTRLAERYGGWFLYALFLAILMWEELWDLEHTAALSGALLLLITTGAVGCSVLFEKRLWCRYLCPIGGMNGMFAKLAFVELRADKGVCTAECKSYECLKGGPGQPPGAPGCDRGLPTAGCPLGSHPANLQDNRDCSFCGSCVKACQNGSVEFRLRPPAADLWENHRATPEELSLMFLLLGALGVHRLPQLLSLAGYHGEAAHALMDPFPTHAALSAALLLLPGVLCWSADAMACAASGALSPLPAARPAPRATLPGWQPGQDAGLPAFVRLSYGWLPLVWAASLAHYTLLFGSEGGSVLSAAAEALHLPRNLAPHAQLAPPVISFLQAALLVGGGGASTALTLSLGRQVAPARMAAQLVGILVAGLTLWAVIVEADFLTS